jgi:hypothetical protein
LSSGWVDQKLGADFFPLEKDHFIFALKMRWDEREVYKVFLRSHRFFTGDTGFFLGLWSVCWKRVVLQWILWIPKNFYKSCNSVPREKAWRSWKLLLKAEPELSTGCRVFEKSKRVWTEIHTWVWKIASRCPIATFNLCTFRGAFLLVQTLNKVCFNLLSFS